MNTIKISKNAVEIARGPMGVAIYTSSLPVSRELVVNNSRHIQTSLLDKSILFD